MLAAGIAAWTGAVVLAGAAGLYTLHHHRAPTVVVETAATAPADEVEPTGAVVLPEDVVLAPRPKGGVTQMQRSEEPTLVPGPQP
jgi:hypothetical protein